MTGTVATQLKAIAFDRDIERLTQGFTGREWVFKEIDRWLQQGNERFFILTGEPGVGKSTIAAQLTQTRKDIAAYHFCIARQISTVEPNNVLLSLAAQLIKYFPDYGEALVNTVKPLFLQVNVEINIENIRDSVVQGVVIENLHIHYPKQALDIVLRQALAALPNPPKESVSILIDSLDEAVTYNNENNLVTLLSSVDDLPSWVRFILTSRPDKQRVLSYFETLKPYYYHLNELSEKNKKDIHQYVDGRVVSELIQVQIQRFQAQSEALINQITELSQGNFLYTKVLLDDIESGGQPLDNLAALPRSLNELYHNFLLRLKAEWEGKYQPIFGILTVTKAPVTEEELANLLRKKLDETELGQRLRVVQQFLDVVQNDYAENTYTLFHQSLQDYLTDKEKSGVFHCSPKAGHRQIIDYCWRYHPRDWRECDHYGLRYLATHLVDMAALEKPPIEAREYIERLHELLATEVDGRNAWFDAKDQIGDTAGFLADVELAWLQADEAHSRDSGKSIGLQCRYALIKASINSLSEIPTELMVALVKHQYWKPSKAIAYARQMPDPQERAESLTAIAHQLPDSEPLKQPLLQSALEAALALQSERKRAEALTALVDKLSDAFPKALEAAQSIKDEYYRTGALQELAEKLTPDLLPKNLKTALAIQNEWERALAPVALKASAEKLTLDLLPKALKTALAIKHWKQRPEVLISLVDKLTPDLLPKALEAAQALQNEQERTEVLTALADKLSDALPKALEAAQSIRDQYSCKDEYSHARALVKLADKLSPDLLPEVLETALAFQDDGNRAEVLTALADKLPPDLLPKALEAALAIQDHQSRAEALTALAGKLPNALPKALEAAQAIQYSRRCARALIELVDKLPPDLLPKALEAALAIQDHHSRAEALTALAGKLPNALPKALEAAQAIENIEDCAETLITLSDKLTLDLLPKALETALAFRDGEYRVQVLTALAHKLTPDLLSKILKAAQVIEDKSDRVQTLTALADRFPSILPQILKSAQVIQDESSCARSMMALTTDKLSDALPKVLEVAQSIQNDYSRAQSLAVLADKIPEALPMALEAAQAVQDQYWRVRSLIALADKIHPDLYPTVLEAIQTGSTSESLRPHGLMVLSESLRPQLLTALVNKLPENLYPKALEAIQMVQDEKYCAQALTALAAKLPKALPKALEAAQALQNEFDRAQILTALVDKLTPDLLPAALEAAKAIHNNGNRAQVLTALVDKLPHVFPQAIEAFQKVRNEDLAGCMIPEPYMELYLHELALIVRAGKLPNGLSKALEQAQAIHDEYHRSKELTILANKLTPDLLLQALAVAQKLPENYRREALEALINNLIDRLTPDLLSKALEAAPLIWAEFSRAHWTEFFRTRALTALLDKLPNALPETLESVQAIQNKSDRAEALTVLVPRIKNASNRRKLWKDSLHFLSYRTRPDLLSDLTALTPVIIALDSEAAATEIAQAIQDVSRWWS